METTLLILLALVAVGCKSITKGKNCYTADTLGAERVEFCYEQREDCWFSQWEAEKRSEFLHVSECSI